MTNTTTWRRAPRRTEITLVPGDPLYEHLLQTNPKKLQRLQHDELQLYRKTHALDYDQQYHEAVEQANIEREMLQKRSPDYHHLGLEQFPGVITRQRVVAAYRKRAKQLHPDAGGSHEAMVELTSAYQRILAGIREQR